jgi:hypothetical protein
MTENMGYRKYRTRGLRAGAPLVLVLVGLVAAVAVARAEDPLGRNTTGNGERVIAAGVTIAGVPVGGYTAHQAASATEDAFAERLVLTTDRRIRLVAPRKLGAHPLMSDAVAGALRAKPGENVELAVDVDHTRLQRYIASLNKSYAEPARDATVVLVNLRPVVKAGEKGLAVRQRALFSELDTALTAGDRTPVRDRDRAKLEPSRRLGRGASLGDLRGRHRTGDLPDSPRPVRDRHEAGEPLVVSARLALGRRPNPGASRARQSARHALDGPFSAGRRDPWHP